MCGGSIYLDLQLVKNLPAMRETWVRSQGWEDPLEKGKVTHSRILAWRISWTVLSMGSQRVGHGWATFMSIIVLQCCVGFCCTTRESAVCACTPSHCSCVWLCSSMDCSLSGSSVHGILQAGILKWVAMPSSRGSCGHWDWTNIFCIAGGLFTHWATWEAQIGKRYIYISPPSWPCLPLPHLTPLGHHWTLSWAPFVIQQLLTSYLFHTWSYICQCYTLNLSHPLK